MLLSHIPKAAGGEEDEINHPAWRPTGWDHLYLFSPPLSFLCIEVLAVSLSFSLRLWDKGGFLCGTGAVDKRIAALSPNPVK